MLTVKLTKSSSSDPQNTGLERLRTRRSDKAESWTNADDGVGNCNIGVTTSRAAPMIAPSRAILNCSMIGVG